jgi:hypothetical protein
MYKDFEGELLVSKNEEGDSRIYGQVCHMSAGESEASTTGWRITYNLFRFQNGNERISLWILYLGYQKAGKDMMPYG